MNNIRYFAVAAALAFANIVFLSDIPELVSVGAMLAIAPLVTQLFVCTLLIPSVIGAYELHFRTYRSSHIGHIFGKLCCTCWCFHCLRVVACLPCFCFISALWYGTFRDLAAARGRRCHRSGRRPRRVAPRGRQSSRAGGAEY